MIANLAKITSADLDALATLATAKLAPATPYSFTPFAGDSTISLPSDVAPVATYGGGSWGDSAKVTLRLYGYKTIAGKKTYTSYFRRIVFTGATGSGNFSLTWSWPPAVGANAPEGYIVVIPQSDGADGWDYFWRDLGLVKTFTEDGSLSDPAWRADVTLDDIVPSSLEANLPAGRGAWLKMLNKIRKDLFAKMDIFGGTDIAFTDDFLLSGPWCVSVAPKCYLNGGASVPASLYRDLSFRYSEADSLTGNELAPEADMLAFYFGADNGANTFDWGVNGTLNGRIALFSAPNGQNQSDWNISAAAGGAVDISFDANYHDPISLRVVAAFIFDFVNVPYTVGAPVILTVTPLAGGSIIHDGTGCRMDLVFTGVPETNAAVDAVGIHLAGPAAKSAALANSLADIVLTTHAGNTPFAAHWRAFCPGVFIAKTLPTAGLMTYLDVDLPQYAPQESPLPASSRRVLRNNALPPMPVVGNKSALWPVFRDTDFTPDNVAGRPLNGSKAWQVLGTKYATPNTFTDPVVPTPLTGLLVSEAVFVPAGTADARFLVRDPNLILYVRANLPPTLADFDGTAAGGTWFSLAESLPGFATNTLWFYGFYNPTAGTLTAVSTTVLIARLAAPTGTFFPTQLDDNGRAAPQLEGASYHLSDPQAGDHRPIPLYGYCVFLLTARRAPGASTAADLPVKIGLMKDFSFDAAGTFEAMTTMTVPAGQSSITLSTFWPVLGGAPLAYQLATPSSEPVTILAAVNFQPLMHSTFSPQTTQISGGAVVIGHYAGPAWFQPERALLFFKGDHPALPILLPIAATIYNDLTAALELLP